MRINQRLAAGTYRAENELAVHLFTAGQDKEYTVYQPGEEFAIPDTQQGCHYAVADDSETFAECEAPQYTRIN